jgi:uncharacterized protein YrrD
MQRLGTAFNGFAIEASDGKVGTVSDFLFDDKTWMLRWLVVDTGKWLSERKILIHPASLEKPDVIGRAFEAKLTKAQVEKSPPIQQHQPVSAQMEQNLYGYYGYDPLWGTEFDAANGIVRPVGLAPPARGPAQPEDPPKSDSHLRSIAEVKGYNIHAVDGEIGHLEDFLIDDESWKISYLVIDTKNWWFGKHVVVSPTAIAEISWPERYLRLDLTCYKIKGSPPWSHAGLMDRAYEGLLQTYYGWDATTGAPPPATAPIAKPVGLSAAGD